VAGPGRAGRRGRHTPTMPGSDADPRARPTPPAPRPGSQRAISERDYVQSLARGLAVLRGFADHGPSMTLAEVAEAAEISRPAARRLLLTLIDLGYVRGDRGVFALSPRILMLGQAYLSSLNLVDIAQPHLKELADATGETTGLTTLDDTEIVFVARVGAQRIMSAVLVVGSRLPAYPTAMGRVLLAGLAAPERRSALERSERVAFTPRTLTDVEELLGVLDAVERDGFALVDQEVEDGLRSVAVAVRDQSGSCVAAVGSSCHASRVSNEALRGVVLPQVRETGRRISVALGFAG
jgi:IclR family pca regulon transcriptional regulator